MGESAGQPAGRKQTDTGMHGSRLRRDGRANIIPPRALQVKFVHSFKDPHAASAAAQLCLCTTAAAEKNKRGHDRRVPTLSFTLITENLALTPSAEINAIAEASVAHSKLSVI